MRGCPYEPPPLPGAAAPLSETEIVRASDALSCDVATIRAVRAVESAGSGFLFGGSRRPQIRFEAHLSSRLTKRRYDVFPSQALGAGLGPDPLSGRHGRI